MNSSITYKKLGAEISFSNNLNINDLIKVNEVLHSNKNTYYDHVYSIWDFTNASLNHIPQRDFIKVIAPDLGLAFTHGHFKIALVVEPNNDKNLLCEYYKKQMTDHSQWDVETFDNYKSALIWCMT